MPPRFVPCNQGKHTDTAIRNVRPSHLEEWLAILDYSVSYSSYNPYAEMPKAFEVDERSACGPGNSRMHSVQYHRRLKPHG